MKDGQTSIYYMAADSRAAAESAPFVEQLVKRDYEVRQSSYQCRCCPRVVTSCNVRVTGHLHHDEKMVSELVAKVCNNPKPYRKRKPNPSLNPTFTKTLTLALAPIPNP